MIQIFHNPNYDFVKWRHFFVGFSLILFCITLISIGLHGGMKPGLDFKGGLMMEVRFSQKPDLVKIRQAISAVSAGDAEIKVVGEAKDNGIQILVQEQKDEKSQNTFEKMLQSLQQQIGGVTLMGEEMVGPKIGKELRWGAAKAIIFALLSLILYIGFRYKIIWGMAAVIGVFHDVVIVLGVFSLLDREVTIPLIAALLTLLGYSINDTIVVFDRMRENLKLMKQASLTEVINRSINQSMGRSIITVFTVFLVCLVLYIYGGAVVNDFALAMLIGSISGCYSSIYIAAPIILFFVKKKPEASKA
jgi:preprotein translocase subunit SecF